VTISAVCPHCQRALPARAAEAPAFTSCPSCLGRLEGKAEAKTGGKTDGKADGKIGGKIDVKIDVPRPAPRAPAAPTAPAAVAPRPPPPAARTPPPTARIPPPTAGTSPVASKLESAPAKGEVAAGTPIAPAVKVAAAARKIGEPPRAADRGRDAGAPEKIRSDAFASALSDESATRATPVHAFAIPPDALPSPARAAGKGVRRGSKPQIETIIETGPAAPRPNKSQPAGARVTPAPAAASPAAPSPPAAAAAAAPARAVAAAFTAPSPALAAPSPALSTEASPSTTRASKASTQTSAPPSTGPAKAGSSTWPSPSPSSSSSPLSDEEPASLRLRTGWPSIFDRLPIRGLSTAIVSAMIVLALGAGGMKLFARSGPARPVGVPAIAKPPAAAPAPAPGAISARPTPTPAPRLLAMAGGPPAPRVDHPVADPADPADSAAAAEPTIEPRAPAPARASRTGAAKRRAAAQRATRRAAVSAAASRRRAASKPAGNVAGDSGSDGADRITRAREAYRQGNARLFAGAAAAAITAYAQAVHLDPKNAAGYRGLGLANAQLGRRTDAVRYLRAYLKRAPDAEDRALITDRISLLQTLP
jgi:hypothetical protein